MPPGTGRLRWLDGGGGGCVPAGAGRLRWLDGGGGGCVPAGAIRLRCDDTGGCVPLSGRRLAGRAGFLAALRAGAFFAAAREPALTFFAVDAVLFFFVGFFVGFLAIAASRPAPRSIDQSYRS